MTGNQDNLKLKILHELRSFLFNFTFLALFFCSLISYSNLLIGEYEVTYLRYGYGLLEALILSKIIMLGQTVGLGERFNERSLIIPTLYKTVIFTLFALLFSIIEHFVLGLIHKEDLAKIYHSFLDKGIDIDLAKIQVIFLAFFLFFAFMETARVMGDNKLLNLFIRRNSSRH